MRDAKFYFNEEYICLDEVKFSYTEPRLKNHYKALKDIKKQIYGFGLKEKNTFYIGQNLNTIENWILENSTYALLDIEYIEDYEFTTFWDWCEDEWLYFDFFEYNYNLANAFYQDHKKIWQEEDNDFVEFHRFFVDILKYHSKRFEILDNLSPDIDWSENEKIQDIVNEEYEDNIYFKIIDQNYIFECLLYFHELIIDNVLCKADLKKLQSLEKKGIKELLSYDESLNFLKYNRLYNTKKVIKEENPKKNIEKKCYILKDKSTGYYKIGKSNNPNKREKTLQSEKPTYEMIKTFTKDYETELHKKYYNQRLRGEWFNLNKVQVEYICRHYQ